MIFRLHHGLKEISQLGRSVKRLDQQEQFGRLDPVVSGALNQFGDNEQSGKKRLDHRVERQRRNRISGDDRIFRCRSTENIPLAKTETARQRQHHGTGPFILSRQGEGFAARQTGALFRSDQPNRIVCPLEFQRSRQDKHQTDNPIGIEPQAITDLSKRQEGKTAIGDIADTAERRGKRRTPTTIRSTTLSPWQLLKLRFGLIIHIKAKNYFRTKIRKKTKPAISTRNLKPKIPAVFRRGSKHGPSGPLLYL